MYIPRRSPLQNMILDIFRGGGQQQQQQQPVNNQQQQQNNNQQQTNNPNVPPNGGTGSVLPDGTSTNPNQKTGDDTNKSPLADFADLWNNPTPKDGDVVEPDWNDPNSIVPAVKIDQKKLMEAASRIDFSKLIDPALADKALKGDVGAFNQIINRVMQGSFANMSLSMTKIAESMSRQMAERIIGKALPHHLRNHTVSQKITEENPIFSDPAVAPMLEMVKAQFALKYPKASPQEISQKAKQYLGNFADTIKGGGKPPAIGGGNNRQNKGGEPDNWLEFAGVENPQQ